VSADVGYNWVRNAAHVTGRNDDGLEGRIKVSIAPLVGFATEMRD
jgi:hypothetical protein